MDKFIRVKVICSWCNSKQLCENLSIPVQRHVNITWEDIDVDYYVILERPFHGERFELNKTIVVKSGATEGYEHNVLKVLAAVSIPEKWTQYLEEVLACLENMPCDIAWRNDTDDMYQKYFSDVGQVKNICFLHSCSVGHVSRMILNQMVSTVLGGLIHELDHLYIINVGEDIIQSDFLNEKIRVINYSKNTQLFEKPTLNLMLCFSKYHPNTKILYLHTKGVSYSSEYTQIADWRNLLLYFLVERHRSCLKLLDEYDAIGSNYATEPHPHFSGNFWWSTGKHISTLSPITSNVRHDCEWWLLSNSSNVKTHELYRSNVNHYHEHYPRQIYDNAK